MLKRSYFHITEKERQITHTHTSDPQMRTSAVAHLHVKIFPHTVDSDPMESSIRQVVESRAEHVRTPVRLQVIPDLQTPYEKQVWL